MASGQQFSGTGYGNTRIHYDWNSTPNYAGNYSTVNVTLYLDLGGGTSVVATENGNINVAGAVSGYSRGSTSRGPGGTHVLHSYSRTVGHDNNGNATIYIGGSYTSGFGSMGSFSTGQNWNLDSIPRYADITAFNFNQVTDEKLQWTWSASAHCDYVSWWSPQIDGGAHHDIPVSGSSGFSITRANLPSNTQHAIYVAVRRADSGLWREAGPYYATTSGQNNFMDFADII